MDCTSTPTKTSLLAALKNCGVRKDLKRGKELHSLAVQTRLILQSSVANTLINVYAKCGVMDEARQMFDQMVNQNVVSWNSLILGYVENGQSQTALTLFEQMPQPPDSRTYLAALSACSALASEKEETTRWLQKAREIHSRAVADRCCNIFVESALVEILSKFACMREARFVFDNMTTRDVVSWNSLIKGYVENGESELALEAFETMESSSDCRPVSRTYVAALTACGELASRTPVKPRESNRWLEKGRSIHTRAVETGCCNIFVESILLDFYSRCARMEDARRVFDNMSRRDVVAWNSMIKGYVDNGDGELALQIYDRIKGCTPDSRTYLAALAACGSLAEKSHGKDSRWLEKGREVHARAVANSCSTVYVQSVLVDMYSKFGEMAEARRVFDSMHERAAVAWNSLIQGYVTNGDSLQALEVFRSMKTSRDGSTPDARTYLAALTAVSSLGAAEDRRVEKRSRWLDTGQSVHSEAVASRNCDIFVENTSIDMYSKCGSMSQARKVFDEMIHRDVVSWTVLIQGYVDNGECRLALELFDVMETRAGCLPDSRTYVAALQACSALAASKTVKLESTWLDKAKDIQSTALSRNTCDTYVWNCLAWGYVDNGRSELALKVLAEMDLAGQSYNPATFVAGLTACGNLMALETGKLFHEEIQSFGLETDLSILTCLVELYGKCGCMDTAKLVFDSIPGKDVWAWNALIAGYSHRGDALHVLELFHDMRQRTNLSPNEFTFTHILTACSHAGLTEKGREYFASMDSKYGVARDLIHYTCLVDLLARANRMDEAMRTIESMPFEADAVTWAAVLGACQKWENVELAEVAYEKLIRLAEGDAAPYVLMANILGMSEDTET